MSSSPSARISRARGLSAMLRPLPLEVTRPAHRPSPRAPACASSALMIFGDRRINVRLDLVFPQPYCAPILPVAGARSFRRSRRRVSAIFSLHRGVSLCSQAGKSPSVPEVAVDEDHKSVASKTQSLACRASRQRGVPGFRPREDSASATARFNPCVPCRECAT